MYRDVKKKLLSVVICICMLIGMVQVVPKVKAADNKEVQVTATYGSGSQSATFKFKLKTDTLRYNGSAQLPEIVAGSVECSNTSFSGSLSISGIGGVNAGSYKCTVTASQGNWNFPDDCIDYTIEKARITNISARAKDSARVQKYTGNTVCLKPEDIEVTADISGKQTTIDPSQYSVTGGQSACGSATCKIVIKGTNYDGVLEQDNISYIIAYDLGGNAGYTASIDKTSVGFTDPVVLPNITLSNGLNVINVANYPLLFDVKYYKNGVQTAVDSVGDYTVEVTPYDEASYCTYDENTYFTGKYTAQFSVGALDAKELIVVATDPTTGQQITIYDKSNPGNVTPLIVAYKKDTLAEPPVIVQARTKDGTTAITGNCSITYPNASSAGEATIVIKPDTALTNYSGTLTIKYYIKSDIELTSYRFGDQNPGINQIVYDGLDHTLAEKTVTNAAGIELTENLDYRVTYQYWNGSSYQDADATNRKTVGKKRVLFTGLDTFQGRDTYLEYEIKPVDISEGGPYWRNVSVNYTDGPYVYTGKEIKPAFTVKYNGLEVGTNTDTNGQFTYTYKNNIDAGTATLEIIFSGVNYKGTYISTYTIGTLAFSSALIDSPYTYSGSNIAPVIRIGDYVMNGNPTITDYEVLYYDDDESITTAPSEGGNHSVTIKVVNTNNIYCSGGFTKKFPYVIAPKNIADLDIHLDPKDVNANKEIAWNGGDTKPGIVVPSALVEGTDYEVEYSNYSGVSEYSATATDAAITITGKGNNYTGTKVLRYKITPRVLQVSDEFAYTVEASINPRPDYSLTISLTDYNRQIADQKLKAGDDYTIENVFYYDDLNSRWETLVSGSAFQVSGNQVMGLQRAGKYKVTISGTKNYVGSLTNNSEPAVCGTDISGYIPHIEDENTEYTYTGNSITPAAISLYKDSNTIDNTITDDCYTISYTRADGGNDTKNVGKVYVIATANPEKGYFGKTQLLNVKKAYYEIVAPIWSSTRPLTVKICTNGGIYYEPNGMTVEPEVIVSFSGIGLKEGRDRDYTVTYTGSQSAGKDRMITITGMGNYANEKNIWREYYDVFAIDISEDANKVRVLTSEADYGKGEAGFRIEYGSNYELQPGSDKDYTYAAKIVSGSTVYEKSPGEYETTYIVVGKNNFTGTREISIKVNQSNLAAEDGAKFTKDGETPQPGEYYVTWSSEEMFVDKPDHALNQRDKCKPENFTINYMTETGSIPLTRGKDYKVLADEGDNYGTNATPGYSKNNYLTIEGMGGYTGTRKLYFTLYTDISKVQLATTSTLQESTGASGTAITKSTWKAVYEGSTTDPKSDGLVILNSLYQGESFIDPSEYDISWPGDLNLADPAVGTYKATIVGTPNNSLGENAHYYKGNRDVTFTIVNGIENAEIKVNSNNCVQYTGGAMTVTGAATTLSVKVDNVALTLGRDFEIVGYENNTQIGEAIVKIKGIGNYQGEAQGTFYITYPLSKMGVQMQNADNSWVDVSNGSNVSFRYNQVAKEPMVRLYCKEFEEDIENLTHPFTVAGGYFEIEYLNNTNAGTATARIKNCKYFTSDIGFRDISFAIVKNSICPTAVTGGTISYSPIAAVNGNLSITYTGKSITVEDLKLALYDGGNLLSVGTDYAVFYKNDNQNVSVPGSEPVITVKGIGNYDDDYSFAFRITPKDINDGISVQPVMITFTGGTIDAAVKQQMNVIQDDIGKTLKCGTDFTIEAYYLDQYGHGSVTGENGIPNAQGTYYAKIEGRGNYTGNRLVQINVSQKDMGEGMTISFTDSDHCKVVLGEPQCVYDGTAHEPGVVVTYGSNTTLVPNVDYTVSFADNVNAGTATVTVNGIGNYTGTTTETFTIAPKQIDDYSIYYSPIQEVYPFANGASVEPDSLLVRDTLIGNYELQKGTEGDEKDYTIDYLSEYDALERQDGANLHSYAGQVTMTVKGQGNYTGEKVFTYYIGEDISQCRTLVNGRDSVSVEYNGLVLAPEENSIAVIAGGSTDLTDANGEKRYDIAYYKGGFEKTDVVTRDQIVDAATYYVAVVGVPSKGTYAKSSESNSCKFTINPRSIAPSYILVSGYDGTYYYTGQQICPKGIAVEDTDLPVSLDENDPQRRTVKLINGIDYDLTYANNTSAGKASIIVSGKGNYAGSRVAYFNIISSNADGNNTWDGSSEGTGSISNGSTTIAASDIILGYDNSTYNCMMYNGYERIPTVNIAGISNSDFIITASNNVQPGVATLTITGRGTNFTGTIIKQYKIKADLSTYGTISRIEDQVYTGSQITPHVTVTCGRNVLNQGSDFTVSYMNNTNVGRATVMATATSDSYYIGTATGSFNISNTAVGMEITGYASTYTYTGNAITPDVVVTMNGRTLTRGTDYIVTYSNNTNVGTATMTINGIGSFSGTKTINYTIEAKNIENCLTTAVTNYQYTGNTYTPNVTVTDSANGKTLVAGTDYTITYSNNTNPGTALITVTALSNNYTGTKVIPFKITSASVSGLRTSTIKNNSIKLAWTAQDYADGYQICNSSNRVVATTNKNSYTVKGLTSCTTYKFKVRSYVENADGSISYGGFSTAVSAKTLLNTPTLKATSTSKGKVKLTWTKVAKATGYEIYYSTKKNGVYTRLKTISKSSSRKYVDSGLASGEKYYYTIRAYRTSNGVKTYSNYNTIKAVKVK